MIPKFGPLELVLILVIVTMLFGVGKLPEVFGSVGRGIREFRKQSADPLESESEKSEPVETSETAPVSSAPASAVTPTAATPASEDSSAPVAEPAEKQQAL